MATMTDKELDRWWINATEGLYIGNGQPYTPSAMPEEASANIKHLIKQYAASELEALKDYQFIHPNELGYKEPVTKIVAVNDIEARIAALTQQESRND